MGEFRDVSRVAAFAEFGRRHYRGIVGMRAAAKLAPAVVVLLAVTVAVIAGRAAVRTLHMSVPSMLRWGAAACLAGLLVYAAKNALVPRLGYSRRRPLPAALAVGAVVLLALSFVTR